MHFSPKLKISLWVQLFLILWVKSNTKNWKLNFFVHFFNLPKPSKVLLHNAPMWNRANKKIHFFQSFDKKNMYTFFNYQFYIKNLFFWGTLCWYGSKNNRIGEGWLLQILLNTPPCPSLNFWGTSTKFTSKEQSFHIKLISMKNMHCLTVEILKKIKFSSWSFFT